MPRKGYVIFTLEFRQDGKRWLGGCRELGTATYGRTLKQVHDELIELVTLHLNTLDDVGERERFFKEHDIRVYHDAPPAMVQPAVPVDSETFVHAHSMPLEGLPPAYNAG